MSACMAVSMLMQTLYLLADLYFGGRLEREAIAAVGVAGNLAMIVTALTQTLGIRTAALLAQAQAGRISRARSVFQSIGGNVCTGWARTCGGGLSAPRRLLQRAQCRRKDGGIVSLNFLPSAIAFSSSSVFQRSGHTPPLLSGRLSSAAHRIGGGVDIAASGLSHYRSGISPSHRRRYRPEVLWLLRRELASKRRFGN